MINKRIGVLIVAIMVAILIPNTVQASTGARHYVDSLGNVFLGGNYIEVGISPTGVFGTTDAPNSSWGFHFIEGKQSNGAYLGLISDGDGWDKGNAPINGDFFTPGDPEERWILAYEIDGTSHEYVVSSRDLSDLSGWKQTLSLTDTSTSSKLSATLVGVTNEDVKITIVYSFTVGDLSYTTNVKIENLGSKDLKKARFLRSFDPDQDHWLHGNYNTYNKVVSNPVSTKKGGSDNYALVIARGKKTLSSVFFFSTDNRARVSESVDFDPDSAYLSGFWDDALTTSKTYATDEDVALSFDALEIRYKFYYDNQEVSEDDFSSGYEEDCDDNYDADKCSKYDLDTFYYVNGVLVEEEVYDE